jgi:hypothetical protein
MAVGIGAACVAGGTAAATAPSAAKGPAITVKPATSLKDRQVVLVKGVRFRPKDQVYIVECLATAKGQAQCDLNTVTPATISATGRLPATKFKVVTGKVGSGSCGTKSSNLARCDVSVGNASGGDTATLRIKFAPPK